MISSKIIIKNLRKKIDSFEEDPDIAEFREKLKVHAESGEKLDLLSFTGNSYGSNFFIEIEPYLAQIPTIERVNLNDIFTQRRDDLVKSLEILSRVLTGKEIRVLDISHNALSITGCEAICEFIKNCDKLEYFWANNCGLAQNGSIHIAKAIEEGELPLKLLSVTRNRIEVKAIEFGNAVKKLPNLEELIIFQNGIKEEGMAHLLDSCKSATKLRKLDVSDNWIKNTAVDNLCELIVNNENLVEVNIGDCNIDPDRNVQILEALKQGKQNWVGFGHDYNELSDPQVAKEFVECLTKPGTLKWLSLKGNEFDEETIEVSNGMITTNVKEHEVNVLYESDYEDMDDDDQEDEGEKQFKGLIDMFENLKLE